MKPPKKQFKPQNLRTILAVSLALLVLGGGAAFYLGINIINDYATKVNHRLIDAEASGKQIQGLQTLKNQLNQSTSLVQKANQIFATPASYQSQALSDLKRYADASGLAITNTTFTDAATTGTYSVTISLKQPVSYNGLINFLNNIEGNLPKMQVSSINLGQAGSGGSDSVKTGDIKIDISVR